MRLVEVLSALQDFGHNWVNLTQNSGGAVASFWDFDWGASLHRGEPRRGFPDETILASVYEKPAAMKGPYPGWDKDIHFVASHDFFKSAHNKLVSCGNQFELIGKKVPCSCRLVVLVSVPYQLWYCASRVHRCPPLQERYH